MLKRCLRQTALFFLTILFISFVAFLLLHMASSDPAEIRLARAGIAYTPEQLEATREELGLNDPLFVQYFRWLKGLALGDLGTSLYSDLPVADQILSALPNTLMLSAATLVLSVSLSLLLGILCALRQSGVLDRIVMAMSNGMAALPGYFVSLVFLMLFALRLQLVPVIIREPDLQTMILPAVALSFGLIPGYVRQVRAVISGELHRAYVTGAKSRGIRTRRIFIRHILRNSALPLLNMVGLSLGGLIGGSIIVETIFGWPGLGLLAMDAISQRDYTMLQGYIVLVATAYFLINLVIDFCGRFLTVQQKRAED